MTIVEELRAQGFKEGFELGLQQALRELASRQRFVIGLRKGVEHVMTLRFGPLPEPVTARIQAAAHELLDRWLDRMVTAATPEAGDVGAVASTLPAMCRASYHLGERRGRPGGSQASQRPTWAGLRAAGDVWHCKGGQARSGVTVDIDGRFRWARCSLARSAGAVEL